MLCHRNFGGIYQVNITVVEDIAYLTLQAKYIILVPAPFSIFILMVLLY